MLTSITYSVSSSLNPSVFGQSVTFTASESGGTLSGYVQFMLGATNLGCQTVSGASHTATLTTTTLPVATTGETVTATRYPTSGCTGSPTAMGSVSQVVNPDTTTVLSSSLNPAKQGDLLTFTATVASVPPQTGTPPGNVAFQLNGTNISGCAAQALNGSGIATCSTSSLPATSSTSADNITAVYAGSGTYSTSTSSALSQGILQYADLASLPYGYYLIKATSGALSSTNGTAGHATFVVVEVASTGISECTYTSATYHSATGYFTGGTCSGGFQSLATGAPVYVPVQ